MPNRDCVAVAMCLLLGGGVAHGRVVSVPAEQPTIQAGLDAAAYGDTVLVSCGTYYEHDLVMKSGVRLRSEGGTQECAIIDAEQLGRAICCYDVDQTTEIGGFTIRNGLAADYTYGGGLHCVSGSPQVERVLFMWNSAHCGGGVFCDSGSAAEFRECGFVGNSIHTSSGVGGGIYVSGGAASISGCEFRSNSRMGLAAGGGAMLILQDCTFLENWANQGGAMRVNSGSAWLDGCDFTNNTAYDLGGAISVYACQLNVSRCNFLGNTSANYGGAVICFSNSSQFTECVFAGNTSGQGAGFTCWAAESDMRNCTFVGNSSTSGGGVLYGRYEADVELSSSVIAFSEGACAAYCEDISSVRTMCCDIYGNTGGDWVGCLAGQLDLIGNISEDPMFCDLDGGDFAIHGSSPCAAPNNSCGDLLGALNVGCDDVAEPRSWGYIKSLYR